MPYNCADADGRRSSEGGKVVAIAGEKRGADSAAIFVVSQKNKWPILEEIISSPSS